MSNYKSNIIANYASQIYVSIAGIIFLPMYIRYMGNEAYGLVGFFAMLQAWFAVLDLGLTPTIGRETSRYKGGAVSALSYRRLYRALSIIFFTVAFSGGSILFLCSEMIATKWLNINNIPVDDVIVAVQIMAISVALRWMTGLSRGVITGSEKLVWLSYFNVIIATLRFVGVFISMWSLGFTPIVFFIHQLFVAILEYICLAFKTYKLLPDKNLLSENIGWSFKSVRPVLKFSLTIAFTAAVWVFVTQTDKLVLSGVLDLDKYGYFTLAVLVANGILLLGAPLNSATIPRMARLNAEGKHDEMIITYRKATQLIAIIAGSVSLTLFVMAKPLLFTWTGDEYIALQTAPIMQLYALGNLFLSISAMGYYLQFAVGNLRYHLIGNIGLAIILIPLIVIVSTNYGGIGAGIVWLVLNFIYLFTWIGFVHHKLVPGLYRKWIVNDALRIIIPASFVALLFYILDIKILGKIESILYISLVGLTVITIAFLFSDLSSSIRLKYFKGKA